MDHNLVLGLALGLAMIVELLPQLAGYAKPDLGVPPSSGERQTVNQRRRSACEAVVMIPSLMGGQKESS